MEKLKILVVDDTPSLLKLGTAIFESGGYEVFTATDGVEALEIISANSISLVITNILMPNMDGYTLCYKIRSGEATGHIPIIIYSATYTSESDEELALQTGANLFIRKPANMSFLLNSAIDLIANRGKNKIKIEIKKGLSDVTRQYNAGLIEKLEQKNKELEIANNKFIESYAEIETLLDNTDEIFLTLDRNLNIVTFNKNAKEAAAKYLKKELKKGAPFFNYAAAHDRVAYLEKVYSEVLAGEKRQTENVFDLGNGEKAYFNTIIKPILNAAGEVEGVFVIERNITETVVKQKQIEFDRRNLDALINSTADMMWSVDKNHKLITSNKAFEDIVAYMSGKAIAKGNNVLETGFSDERLKRWEENYRRAFSGETFTVVEFSDTPVEFWSEISFYPILKDNRVIGTACYSHNITNRKRAEQKINSLNRLYTFVSAINQTIVHVTEEQTLLDDACRIAVEIGKFQFAWIGIIDEQKEKVSLVAQYNATPNDLEVFSNLHYKDYGPTANVLRNWTFFVINNFDTTYKQIETKKYVLQRGFKSCIVLPIKKSGKIVMTYNLFSTQADLFDDEEIRLLDEISGDISFALDFFEKERHRNQILRELLQNELRLEKAQSIAKIGSWSVDFLTGIVEWSDDFFNIYGVSPGEKNKSIELYYSLIHPDDLDRVKNTIAGSVKLFQNDSFQHRILRTDGTIKQVQTAYQFEFDLLGKPMGLFWISHDITELKEAEERIIHNAIHLKQAQEIAHFGNWNLDFSTDIAVWSEEACRIYGLDPYDNIQNYEIWVSFVHPDDLEYVMKVTKESRETLSNSAFYHRIVRRDGTIRYVYSQAHFEFNNEGKPVGLYGVVHDETDVKEAEIALYNSEANMRIILDHLPIGIFAKNLDGKYLFANEYFAQLYGLKPNELINRSIIDSIPKKEETDYFIAQDREVILSGEMKVIPETKFTDSRGNLGFYKTTKIPYYTAGSNENAVLGITEDITKEKLAEAERNKMIADIVQRNKDLEQFSYIVSHNLRAPVSSILGIVDLLKHGDLDKGDEAECIKGLFSSTKSLDNVIKDLNAILALKHNDNKNKELVKFSGIISEIKHSIGNLIENENVTIQSDFSSIDEITTLRGYIYSIFLNLITNSIKYRQKKLNPIINISSAKHENKVILSFKDNGLGIDLDKQKDKVFGLYKRFHLDIEGKGMGLFMVKTQVESLGGIIKIVSQVNKGTEFTIELKIN